MPPPYHGSCLCKEVEFEVVAEHIIVSRCHCSNCRKYTGTVFTTNIVFPAGSTKVTKGDSLIRSYQDNAQDSGNTLERVFCGKCASPLYNLNGDFGRTLAVFYSALDDFEINGEPFPPPQAEYYSKDRVHWVHIIDGAEQPKTKPGRD